MKSVTIRPMGLTWVPVLGLALLAACGVEPAGPAIAADANSNQVTIGMNLKISEAGRLKADLFADTAVTPEGETRSQLKKVRLTFYEPGRQPSRLTSKTGEYDQTSGMMTARGNVVLITQGDKGMRTIKSEELHWDQGGDRVWSEKSTTIVENGQTLISDGFTSNSAFTNVQGKNAVVQGVKVGSGGITF
ncbi:LPS export ABC transporter periplasmic protein LptC [Longimicrobium sp.]|uniref:LPS export ABC transporter periplasmic protein LptC n=1 Tax=Longimicrobium sp. TaxID=2029185 RepID=UPI002B8E6BC2|nr:LPS export ABC transporter periplasmic protein LptC [Longimicrobium sp.]HSU18034.1 LPS export ABC transporter periplasmic protein LptC [Longimicrobium sp.]